MLLRRKQKKDTDRKKPQEQFAKIRAFPGSYGFPSAGTDSLPVPADQDPASSPDDAREAGVSVSADTGDVRDWASSGIRERISL